jgi:uncharacterized phage protein (TIGR01671 family)
MNMNGHLEFRVWDTRAKAYSPFNQLCHFFSDGTLVFQEFVGLKDENRKKIFEGDIILIKKSNGFETIGIAKIGAAMPHGEESYYGFYIQTPDIADVNPCPFVKSNIDTTYSIIGNVFENPELLNSCF